MSQLTELFTNIAAAIKEKDGTSAPIVASDFPERISAIVGGVGVDRIGWGRIPSTSKLKPGENIINALNAALQVYFDNGYSATFYYPTVGISPTIAEVGQTEVTYTFTWGSQTKTLTWPITVLDAPKCWGVVWDYGNTSPALTRLTPEFDPNGFVTETVISEPDPEHSYSPFDNFYPWNQMEEVWVYGSNSPIDRDILEMESLSKQELRQQKDAVISIPNFWYNVVDDATNQKRYWYISDEYNENYETLGFERHPGSGVLYGRYEAQRAPNNTLLMSVTGVYGSRNIGCTPVRQDATMLPYRYLGDYKSYCAVCILFLIEYATFDASRTIGPGHNVSGNIVQTGETDHDMYHTTSVNLTGNTNAMQYRGIENLYANFWKFQDGVICVGGIPYISNDYNQYDVSLNSSYQSTAFTLPSTMGDVISKIHFLPEYKWSFFPQAVTTTGNTTYTTDSAFIVLTSNNSVVTGDIYHGELAGIMAFAAYFNITSGDGQFGYRIMYRDTDNSGLFNRYLNKRPT